MDCVNRQFAFCLAVALTLPLCAGCGKEKQGKPPTGPGPSAEVQQHSEMPWRVDNWVSRITNGPDGDPGKRKKAAINARENATNPQLTAEMKQKLIDALNKMIESEPMSDAEEALQQEIIAEGKKALDALKGGGGGTAEQ